MSTASDRCETSNRLASESFVETMLVGGTALFREGLRYLLAQTGFRVVASENLIGEIHLADLPREAPALVVLCLECGSGQDISEIRAVKSAYPNSYVVCLCTICHDQDVVPMLESGAVAILLHTVGSDTLVQALDLALLGHRVMPRLSFPLGDETVSTPAPDPVLFDEDDDHEDHDCHDDELDSPKAFRVFQPSAREIMIIEGLVKGESNRAIADRLAIAEGRVKGYVKGILRKTRVKNRTQAAIWGMKHQIGGDGAMTGGGSSRDGV